MLMPIERAAPAYHGSALSLREVGFLERTDFRLGFAPLATLFDIARPRALDTTAPTLAATGRSAQPHFLLSSVEMRSVRVGIQRYRCEAGQLLGRKQTQKHC